MALWWLPPLIGAAWLVGSAVACLIVGGSLRWLSRNDGEDVFAENK